MPSPKASILNPQLAPVNHVLIDKKGRIGDELEGRRELFLPSGCVSEKKDFASKKAIGNTYKKDKKGRLSGIAGASKTHGHEEEKFGLDRAESAQVAHPERQVEH